MKINSIQKLSLQVALAISIVMALVYVFFQLFLQWEWSVWTILLFVGVIYVLIFFIVQYSIQSYISKQIQKISNSNFFLEELNVDYTNLDNNLDAVFKNFRLFVERKLQEIEKLHTRDDFRKEFLGNVSHELKTPLFTAQGYILTLLGESMDDPELHQKYLQRANKSIERLNAIIKDLDMISKLESGMKLNISTFNIVGLINDIFEILEIKAAKRNISLTFDKVYEYPLFARGDFERIEQVLINLITNSINYGKIGGKTVVSIKAHSKKKYLIRIEDNGIGIDPKHIPRLFERFYRVDKSRSREHGGSGLGLAIVKHIIEAHDQELFVESTVGKGSVFSFTLTRVI